MTDLETRLTNWGNWARGKRRPQEHRCRSLEGEWRSPQREHWSEAPRAFADSVDPIDAIEVELAWRSLPPIWAMPLWGVYVLRERPATICRLAKIRVRDLALVLDDAKAAIGASLYGERMAA